MRMNRGLWMCLLSAVLLSTSARAQLVQLTCPGTEATHYEPGVTQTPRTVAFTGQSTLGPCVGLPLGVISASIQVVGSGTLSCSLGSSTFSMRIDWNDGTWSRVEGTSVINARPAGETVIVLTGQVTQGRFLHATVVRTLTLLQTDLLACWTPEGVTDVAGVATLTVTNLL
ncbi:hypothetical protein SAMN05443572_11741 [Myxococcus fulvus]|nr:hypothetical protein [Myxococcus fulvus]SEU41649.1 hypothetical protein SAMN05443572_11741 [Myxococcus fulvus]